MDLSSDVIRHQLNVVIGWNGQLDFLLSDLNIFVFPSISCVYWLSNLIRALKNSVHFELRQSVRRTVYLIVKITYANLNKMTRKNRALHKLHLLMFCCVFGLCFVTMPLLALLALLCILFLNLFIVFVFGNLICDKLH